MDLSLRRQWLTLLRSGIMTYSALLRQCVNPNLECSCHAQPAFSLEVASSAAGEILGIVSSSLYGGVFGTLAVGEYGQLEYLGPNGEVLDAGDAEELGLPSIAGLGFGSGFGPLAIRTKLAAVESRLHVSSVKSKLSSN
jgi:hypothetical protein